VDRRAHPHRRLTIAPFRIESIPREAKIKRLAKNQLRLKCGLARVLCQGILKLGAIAIETAYTLAIALVLIGMPRVIYVTYFSFIKSSNSPSHILHCLSTSKITDSTYYIEFISPIYNA
jgi:hypothetical protein